MSDKVYQIESTSISYEVGFEGDIIYCHLMRRLKETPLNQVSKVLLKKTSLGSGEEISFRIFFMENGKEKKFPWIQAKISVPTTAEFLDDLKERLPDSVVWEDKREQASTDEEGNKVYDLQYLPFGYAGAGLSRGLQIWIYMICLAVLVIPLIYYIYLLSSGGYRIYTNEIGITIKKTGAKKFSWEELEDVDITKISVYDPNNYQRTGVMRLKFIGANKKVTVVMRYDQALPLLKELDEKGEIASDVLSEFS